jgi:hypothetical protein
MGTVPQCCKALGSVPFFRWWNNVSVEDCRGKKLMFFYIFGIVFENLLYNTVNILFLFYNKVIKRSDCLDVHSDYGY